MADKRTRLTLQRLFAAGRIPLEEDFADLFASSLNQLDDGIRKEADQALKLKIPANAGPKEILLLYEDFNTDPLWKMQIRNTGLEISRGSATQPDLFIGSNGNLGIGTDNPQQALHIVGNTRIQGSQLEIGAGLTGNRFAFIDMIGDEYHTDFGLRMIRGNGGPNTYSQIVHRGIGEFQLKSQDASNITILTNSKERMRITPSGNVGIGTDAPQARLQIISSTHNGGTSLWGPETVLRLLREGVTDNVNNTLISNPSIVDFKLKRYENKDSNNNNIPDARTQLDIKLLHETGSDPDTNVMTLRSNGNVGIGTDTPKAKLEIKAGPSTTPNENGLCVYNPGNSGDGQHAVVSVRVGNQNAGNPFISWDVHGRAGWSMGIDNSDRKLKIAPTWDSLSSNTAMAIDPEGKVDIRTSVDNGGSSSLSEAATVLRLSRKGITNTDNSVQSHPNIVDFKLKRYENKDSNNSNIPDARTQLDIKMLHETSSDPDTNVMTLRSDGHVGIGTTSPDAQLDIFGNGAHTELRIFSGRADRRPSIVLGRLDDDNNRDKSAVFGVAAASNNFFQDATQGDFCIRQNDQNKKIFLGVGSNSAELVIKEGKVGIGASAMPSGLQDHANFDNTSLIIGAQSNNGGNSPSDPISVLSIVREGVDNQANANMADFRLGRYKNDETNSRSQLDIFLTHDSFTPRQVMSFRSNGNVGIGTNTPTKGKLEVVGNGDNVTFGPFNYLYNGGQNSTSYSDDPSYESNNIGIYVEKIVAADQFFAFSDIRTKHIIGPSDSIRDLNTLLAIKITDYRPKDTIKKGSKPKKKVIAQQVEEVFPLAVSKHTDVVPDIYQQAIIWEDGWIELATDLKIGERVKLISEKGEEGIYEVLEAGKQKFRIAIQLVGELVFVYGREVDDFLTVDYDAISMLNVSATQALYQQIQTLQQKVAHLEQSLHAKA